MTPLRYGFLAWAALVVVQLAWHGWLLPPENGRIGLALLLTLPPLLLPLIALRRSTRRALLWVGIISLGYFVHGVVAAWAVPPVRVFALIEVGICVILIATLGWIARSGRAKV